MTGWVWALLVLCWLWAATAFVFWIWLSMQRDQIHRLRVQALEALEALKPVRATHTAVGRPAGDPTVIALVAIDDVGGEVLLHLPDSVARQTGRDLINSATRSVFDAFADDLSAAFRVPTLVQTIEQAQAELALRRERES